MTTLEKPLTKEEEAKHLKMLGCSFPDFCGSISSPSTLASPKILLWTQYQVRIDYYR
jgi:hypothetical protein